jgi:transposase
MSQRHAKTTASRCENRLKKLLEDEARRQQRGGTRETVPGKVCRIVIQQNAEGKSSAEIAALCLLKQSTVRGILSRFRKTGRESPIPQSARWVGRKRLIQDYALSWISRYAVLHPAATIGKLLSVFAEKFPTSSGQKLPSRTTLWRWMKRIYGLTFNDFVSIPHNRNTEYAINARKRYCIEAKQVEIGAALFHAIYVDETPWAFGECLTRGICLAGARPVCPQEKRPDSCVTVISAMSPAFGFLHTEFRCGSVRIQEISEFISRLHERNLSSDFYSRRRTLMRTALESLGVDMAAPAIDRVLSHTFIVWDNASIHNSDILDGHSALEQHRLPPYSPFLNPIEESFSYLKHIYVHPDSARNAETRELLRAESTTMQTAILQILEKELSETFCKKVFQHSRRFWDQCALGIPVATREILDRCHEGDEISLSVLESVATIAKAIENGVTGGASASPGTAAFDVALLTPQQCACFGVSSDGSALQGEADPECDSHVNHEAFERRQMQLNHEG